MPKKLANTYFQFKQFIVHQEHCAMKVCTDACIQGAYAAQWLKENARVKNGQRILDIGTGTGLLTLMLLQELPGATVDAVEIDEGAFHQAGENFSHSPWPDRVSIFHDDVRQWDGEGRYHFIISNPPFYDRDLKSSDEAKNLAMHALAFDYRDLVDAVAKYLSPGGKACMMLPPRQFEIFSAVASAENIYPVQVLKIRPSSSSEVFRIVGIWAKGKSDPAEDEWAIRDDAGNYTLRFRKLLKEYYLYL